MISQYGLALDKYWVTQSGYLIIEATLAIYGIFSLTWRNYGLKGGIFDY